MTRSRRERSNAPLTTVEARRCGVIVPGGALLSVSFGEHGSPTALISTIFDADGHPTASFCLGDGIEEIQTTRRGEIWVSYFDEGVFGNQGWGGVGREPLGSTGVVRFTSAGVVTYRFSAPHGFDSMADCYALNVAADFVWVCYYTDFAVVRIDSDGIACGWQTSIKGANAVAISGDRVLLYGAYNAAPGTASLGRLMDGEVRDVRSLVITANGSPVEPTTVVGRGHNLHLAIGDVWWVVDLSRHEALL
jgi:hypothetical protein